jgi:hypothetical protein
LWLRCAGLCALRVWIAIRVIGTVPINSATVKWDFAALKKSSRLTGQRRLPGVDILATVRRLSAMTGERFISGPVLSRG